jgi:hypothetical protein
MTPKGQDPITSVIAAITEHERYGDETDLGDVMLRFSHALTRLPDGVPALAARRLMAQVEVTNYGKTDVKWLNLCHKSSRPSRLQEPCCWLASRRPASAAPA